METKLHLLIFLVHIMCVFSEGCHQIDVYIKVAQIPNVQDCDSLLQYAADYTNPHLPKWAICLASMNDVVNAIPKDQYPALSDAFDDLSDVLDTQHTEIGDLCSVTCGRCSEDEVTDITTDDIIMKPDKKGNANKEIHKDAERADQSTPYKVILIVACTIAFITTIGCIYYAWKTKETVVEMSLQNQDGLYANLEETSPA